MLSESDKHYIEFRIETMKKEILKEISNILKDEKNLNSSAKKVRKSREQG